jgi:hypothetical protein
MVNDGHCAKLAITSKDKRTKNIQTRVTKKKRKLAKQNKQKNSVCYALK